MNADEPILELHGMSRHWGSLRAVDDVSMEIRRGERLALIGPNGAGKSTLFGLLSGFVEPTAGTIRFGSKDITRLPGHRRADLGISVVFQSRSLFDGLSCLDNVLMAVQRRAGLGWRMVPLRHRRGALIERALGHLDAVGLSHLADAKAVDLAQSESRQLALAVALASEPKVVLFDEPTAGMSAAETQLFVELISTLPPTMAMILIEHDVDVVFAVAERIVVLDAGQLIAVGTPDDIRASEDVRRAYLGDARTEELFEES